MPKGDRFLLKADPEDGTTPIANLLLEAVAMAKISGLQKGAILYLWRKTYGWTDDNGKRLKEAKITLAEWAKALDSQSPRCSICLGELEDKHIIIRRQADVWGGYYYKINTHISQWNSNSVNFAKLADVVGINTLPITENATVNKNDTITQSENSNDLDNSYQENNRTVTQNETEQLPKTKPPTLYKEILNKDKENGDSNKSPSLGDIVNDNKKLKKYPSEFTALRAKVFFELKQKRGYQSSKPSAEAVAISEMLKEFKPEDILSAYDRMKSQSFYQDKFLSMMTVRTNIHEVLKNGTHKSNTTKDGFSTEELKASVGRFND